jgi:hypothetical protein
MISSALRREPEKFFAELKRSNVYKVAIAYVIEDSVNTSNQSLEPTQHFVVSSSMMRCPIFKVLGGSAPSR